MKRCRSRFASVFVGLTLVLGCASTSDTDDGTGHAAHQNTLHKARADRLQYLRMECMKEHAEEIQAGLLFGGRTSAMCADWASMCTEPGYRCQLGDRIL